MRLALADPPYLGRSMLFYGGEPGSSIQGEQLGSVTPSKRADFHPEAAVWDDPATHEQLVRRLVDEYDGWAIAMVPDNLYEYLRWVPRDTRIAVWHDPHVMPSGAHPRRRWEAVLLGRAPGRRRIVDVAEPVGDVLTAAHSGDFAGRKPRAWTEWVLTMLGHCPEHDVVDDLFHGSGAVSATLDQGRLTECRCDQQLEQLEPEPFWTQLELFEGRT